MHRFFLSSVEQETEKERRDTRAAKENKKRPSVKRFFTTGLGELMSKESATEMEDKVERFETALEDFNTVAKGSKV